MRYEVVDLLAPAATTAAPTTSTAAPGGTETSINPNSGGASGESVTSRSDVIQSGFFLGLNVVRFNDMLQNTAIVTNATLYTMKEEVEGFAKLVTEENKGCPIFENIAGFT